ncbi:MAG: S49 family peptidase [Alphaproteobacteria bacterium]
MGLKNSLCKLCDKAQNVPVIGGILKARPKVAVIRFSGVIADSTMKRGGISHARFEKTIENAFDLHKLQAVVLLINSPGGSPAQSSLIADQIKTLAKEKDVPVYAFAEDVAASGGYWLACAADKIYAQPSSIIGSIGVISAGFGFQDFIAKHNIERRVYTSGKDKGFLDPFLEEKPADVKRLKTLQSEIHDQFKDWVRERRGEHLKAEDKDLFEGQFWTATIALEKGLIDGLGDYKTIIKDAHGEDIKFKELKADKSITSYLAPGSKIGLPASWSDDLLETLESRAIWNRYGL